MAVDTAGRRGQLVGFREPGFHLRRIVAAHTSGSRHCSGHRYVADGRLSVGLDLRLTGVRAAPGGDDEAGPSLEHFLERVVGLDAARVLLAEFQGPLEQGSLHVVENLANTRGEAIHRNAELLTRVTPDGEHLRLLDVLRSDLDSQRNT